MTKFLVVLGVGALALGAGLWIDRPAEEAPPDPNRHEKIVSRPSSSTAAVTTPPEAVKTLAVRNTLARFNDCAATQAIDCTSNSGEFESVTEPTDTASKEHLSVSDSMKLSLAGVLVGMESQVEQYLGWARLCWIEAASVTPGGCTPAELEAADMAFMRAITPRAESGGKVEQEALGLWWYLRGENSLVKFLENRPLRAQPNNDEEIKAELCLARQETPGLVDARARALHYFNLAESQGAPRSDYVGIMMECMT
jgi:hypothetical protein